MKILWQLPQILLARLVCLIAKPNGTSINGISIWITTWRLMTAISLGDRIIARPEYIQFDSVLRHEYGHCRQSQMLGPFYLVVVGIPSLAMNILTRIGVLAADQYYTRWPENWADKLGGVTRTPITK